MTTQPTQTQDERRLAMIAASTLAADMTAYGPLTPTSVSVHEAVVIGGEADDERIAFVADIHLMDDPRGVERYALYFEGDVTTKSGTTIDGTLTYVETIARGDVHGVPFKVWTRTHEVPADQGGEITDTPEPVVEQDDAELAEDAESAELETAAAA